jgi:hypothetical protein
MKKMVGATKFWVWLIACAIFAAALAPTIHHAKGSSSGNGLAYIAICTTGGLKWLNLKAEKTEDSVPSPGEHNHSGASDCCTNHGLGNSPALLGSAHVTPFAASQGLTLNPSLFLQSPIRLVAWRQPNPRAPPYLT